MPPGGLRRPPERADFAMDGWMDCTSPCERRWLAVLVWLFLGLGTFGVLLYPLLLLPAMMLTLAALALLELAHHVEGRGVRQRALAAGTPGPLLAWGKLTSMASACPTDEPPG